MTPARRFLSALTSRSWAGTPHALAAVGSHRAGQQGQQQLGIGVRCDAAGPPVSLDVWPGPPPEPHPWAAQRAKGKARLGVHEMTCVGDRGMS
jgi:hypothetical protein